MLGEPVRLKLLRSLMTEDLTFSELVENTGCKQANVSKHLSLLHASGLVERTLFNGPYQTLSNGP